MDGMDGRCLPPAGRVVRRLGSSTFRADMRRLRAYHELGSRGAAWPILTYSRPHVVSFLLFALYLYKTHTSRVTRTSTHTRLSQTLASSTPFIPTTMNPAVWLPTYM